MTVPAAQIPSKTASSSDELARSTSQHRRLTPDRAAITPEQTQKKLTQALDFHRSIKATLSPWPYGKLPAVKISQYVYFGFHSQETHPDEITLQTGVEPTEVRLRGGRHEGPPPVPRSHIWKVKCDEGGRTVDEQLAKVMERVVPRQAAIQALVGSTDDVKPRLVVARFFNDDEGEEEEITRGEDYTKLAGQHQLLGFVLAPEVLRFVIAVRADFWFDEYG